jgi:uncharacterized protein YjbI with pentapeptide repeats
LLLLRRYLPHLLILALLALAFPFARPYWVAKKSGAGAQLQNALLVLAPLPGANLAKANLAGANLSGANLESTKLRGANLRGANLTNANMDGADLADADLRDASLRRAVLSGADLRRALLKDVDLSFCIYNSKTRWPANFNPTKAGAKPLAGEGADDLAR